MSSRPCRVVVVDDAPDVRMLLHTILEEEGFAVVGEGRNGTEAVELARSEQPDVMLLDLSMPVMDGLEALPQVREASPATAVLVLSGFVNEEVRTKVSDLGAAGCVEKGTDLPGLLAAVRDHCAGGQAVARPAPVQAAATPEEGEARPTAPRPVAAPRGDDSTTVVDADDVLPIMTHELSPTVLVMRHSVDDALDSLAASDAEGAREALETARRALDGITSLLDAFAQAREAATGRLDVKPDVVDLSALVREAVADLSTIAGDTPVVVTAANGVAALADPRRVRQIIANLLSNAAKFSPPGAAIEVAVDGNGGEARVTVRDHGKGVPPEAAEVVFRKYARLGDVPGMGLGLYVARAIARAHGGDLRLDESPGEGARFVLTLPPA